MNVLIARYAGRQDRERLSQVFYDAFITAVLILLFVVAPIGYFLSPHLLDFVNAEPEVQVHALPYLRLLFACGAPLFLMFMLTGAFQASGEPKIPLKLFILTTVLIVVFSMILIPGLGPIPAFGALGAGMGTVMAPTVSVLIALGMILRRRTIIHPPPRLTWLPNPRVIRTVARIGIPTGIQGVLLNLGGVFLLKFIGALEHGPAAQAAYTICYAQLFSLITWPSFGMRAAAGTVMGQNIGAGDPARGKRGVAVAACIGACWAVAIGALYWVIPGQLLALFGAVDEPIATYGKNFLHFLSFSGIFLATGLALTGGLQGAGETKIPMYIAFLSQIVILLGICQYFAMHDALTPTRVWAAILVSHMARMVITFAVFRTEKWAHTQVEFEH